MDRMQDVLRVGGMGMNRLADLADGQSVLHRHGHLVDHLGSRFADDDRTGNLGSRLLDKQFHESRGHLVDHRAPVGDLRQGEGPDAGRRLHGADSGHFGMAESDPRNGRFIHGKTRPLKQVRRQQLRFFFRRMRQGQPAGHIAQSIDVGDAGLLKRIDGNGALLGF